MDNFYSGLRIEYNQCPPGCSACEDACARRRCASGKEGAGIKVVRHSADGSHHALTCLQCSEPACVGICPVYAIVKDKTNGIVRIDEDRCVGCGLCTLACSYGGTYFDRLTRKSSKCNYCEGTPKCVEACHYGVLSRMDPLYLQGPLGNPDLLPQGTPMCPGCLAELGFRIAMKVFGRNTIVFGAPGCAASLTSQTATAVHKTLFTNAPSSMEGVKRYYNRLGREVNVVAFLGDGGSADVAFQVLSAAAERSQNLIYICYDNEAYMATGIQRSSTTPYGAWTFTTPVGEKRRGKEQNAKYLPLLMAFHGIPYAATASLAFPEDYLRKLAKAAQVRDGMAYIHLLSPCATGWKAATEDVIELSRMAVQTNYFPLWEAERQKLKLTHEVLNPQPIQSFTKLSGRFQHMEAAEASHLQRLVNERYDLIKYLSQKQNC